MRVSVRGVLGYPRGCSYQGFALEGAEYPSAVEVEEAHRRVAEMLRGELGRDYAVWSGAVLGEPVGMTEDGRPLAAAKLQLEDSHHEPFDPSDYYWRAPLFLYYRGEVEAGGVKVAPYTVPWLQVPRMRIVLDVELEDVRGCTGFDTYEALRALDAAVEREYQDLVDDTLRRLGGGWRAASIIMARGEARNLMCSERGGKILVTREIDFWLRPPYDQGFLALALGPLRLE